MQKGNNDRYIYLLRLLEMVLMRYGVVVCPHCRNAKIVDLGFKTTRCVRCNKILHVDKLRILAKSNSQQVLREVIMKINMEK